MAKHAEEDGLIDPADNAARKVDKPRQHEELGVHRWSADLEPLQQASPVILPGGPVGPECAICCATIRLTTARIVPAGPSVSPKAPDLPRPDP
jgi:hypothetical protein